MYTDIDCFIMGVLFEVVFTNTTGATQPPAMPWVSETLKDSVHDMKFLWVGKMTSCSWSFWSFRQDAFFLVLLLYGSKWSSSRRSKVGNQVQQFRVYMMAASGLPVPPPPPPRMGWVQNLRFSYIFMEPAKTHWYLHCFDKLGLRNRGICSVL